MAPAGKIRIFFFNLFYYLCTPCIAKQRMLRTEIRVNRYERRSKKIHEMVVAYPFYRIQFHYFIIRAYPYHRRGNYRTLPPVQIVTRRGESPTFHRSTPVIPFPLAFFGSRRGGTLVNPPARIRFAGLTGRSSVYPEYCPAR